MTDHATLVREVLEAIKWWATQRCPMENDDPVPCPLCGATVDGKGLDGVCKAIEATFPSALLTQINEALLDLP